MQISAMTKDNIKDIALLELSSFSSPWSEEALLAELSNPNARFFVATKENSLLGYMGLYNIVGDGYVTNIAVDKAHRRTGVAGALIKNAIALKERENLNFITLEVRTSNDAAVNLYLKHGFEVVGVRKRFYTKPVEDAYIMTLGE